MVRAKKHLGQHFLKDENISKRIADSIQGDFNTVVEIGPGTGVLTKYLNHHNNFKAIELDNESYEFLLDEGILNENQLYNEDFLKMNYNDLFDENTALVGNFPYNISSQILFRVYENRHLVSQMIGMFQKEVAERIVANPGSKTYGILSVLTQAFYNTEYLFTVHENSFNPPPKVKSAVIRLKRNSVEKLNCDEEKFLMIVKQSFNQRRKMIRKSLKAYINDESLTDTKLFTSRPEHLSVEKFVELTNLLF